MNKVKTTRSIDPVGFAVVATEQCFHAHRRLPLPVFKESIFDSNPVWIGHKKSELCNYLPFNWSSQKA